MVIFERLFLKGYEISAKFKNSKFYLGFTQGKFSPLRGKITPKWEVVSNLHGFNFCS